MQGRAAWWAGIIGFVLLFVAVSVQKIWGADTWWQLATGRWIAEHWRVPAVDHLSHTVAGKEWIEMRWVFCLLLYWGWQAGGAALLILAQVVMLGVMWGVMVGPVRRSQLVPVVVGLGMAAGMGRWVLRPELVTYLMVAVFLVVLESSKTAKQQSSKWWRGVWVLPLLQVVWVNSHTLFVMGPVLAWTFVVGRAVQTSKLANWQTGKWEDVRRLAVVAGLVSAACLVNPYFVRGAMFPLLLWREIQGGHVVAANIGEMQSPFGLARWTWDLWGAAGLVVVVAASFVWNWKRGDVARLLMFLGAVFLAVKAQRNVGLLAVMGTWAGVMNVVEAEEDGKAGTWVAPVQVVAGIVSACLAWFVATDRYQVRIGAPREFGVGVVEWNTPAAATEFVLASGAKGPVFNLIRDGGYLAWAGLPVFCDGRLEVYREEFLAELFGIGPSNWASVAGKWGINTAIVPVDGYEGLVGAIAKQPGWVLVHVDHRDVVFVREVPEHAELIAKCRVDLAKPRPSQQVDQQAPAWKRAIGGSGRPWWSMGMAESFIALSSWGNAAECLERTLREFPGHRRATAELAAVDRFLGKTEEGDRLARGLSGEWLVFSDRMLASMLMAAGRGAEAQPVLERAVSEGGRGDSALRVALADVYFQKGEFGKARMEYEAAVALGHDAAAEWVKLGTACERDKDLEGAARAYRRALEKDDSQYQVWNRLGMVLGTRGDRAGAMSAFERALAIRPEFEAARRNLDAVRRAR